MPVLEVPAALLPAVGYAFKHYPENTPTRFKLVASLLHSYCEQHSDLAKSSRTKVCGTGRVKLIDVTAPSDIKLLWDGLSHSKSVWLELPGIETAFDTFEKIMPVILLPDIEACDECDCSLTVESRPATIRVYSEDKLQEGHSYHKKCQVCKSLYYYSFAYHRKDDKQRRFYFESATQQHLLVSTATAFTSGMVDSVCAQVDISAVSFDSLEDQYAYRTDEVVNKQQLEELYFLRKLLLIYASNGERLVMSNNDVNFRKDLEAACKHTVEQVNWNTLAEDHQCDVPGCKEGFIMADGVEKVHRKVCAAPRKTYQLARQMARTVSCCPETPRLGNQHESGSKFCDRHRDLEVNDEPAAKHQRIVVTINVADKRVSTRVEELARDLPDNDDLSVHVGCKKPANVPRFYNRTAGLMVLVKPCGIIVSVSELLTCESASQLFVQLLQITCDTQTNFSVLGYDRACEFEPFLRNLSSRGNAGATLLLAKRFVVDRFHISGHTTASCDITSPVCRYHPDLSHNSDLAGCNTSCAEQCFSWLTKFKNTVKYMTQYKFKFFIYSIVTARNIFIERKSRQK